MESGLLVHLDAANPKSYPGSGTTWFDVSGAARDSTLVNGVSYNSQGFMTFDETLSQSVSVPLGSLLTAITDTMTIECWAYFPSNSTWTSANNSGLFARGSIGGSHGLFRSATNNVILSYYRGTVSGAAGVTSAVGRDAWYHLLSTWNGVDTTQLYINGDLRGSNTAAVTGGFDTGSFLLGANNRPGGTINGSFFTGSLNGCRIYDRVLTDAEVKQNFEAARSKYGI